MGKRREEDPSTETPTFEQGHRASAMLADYYGEAGSFGAVLEQDDTVEPLTDTQAAERLSALASGIAAGKVRSHLEVARTIQGLGPVIGPFGPASAEIGDAAYRVAIAVYRHQSDFTETAETSQ